MDKGFQHKSVNNKLRVSDEFHFRRDCSVTSPLPPVIKDIDKKLPSLDVGLSPKTFDFVDYVYEDLVDPFSTDLKWDREIRKSKNRHSTFIAAKKRHKRCLWKETTTTERYGDFWFENPAHKWDLMEPFDKTNKYFGTTEKYLEIERETISPPKDPDTSVDHLKGGEEHNKNEEVAKHQ